jgi:hypothetical protein
VVVAEIELSRLFIAVPELSYNGDLIDLLEKQHLISHEQADRMRIQKRIDRKAGKVVNKWLSGTGLINRLLAVAPELISVEMINLLRATDLLTLRQGHALRLALDAVGALTKGGMPNTKIQIFRRLMRLGGVGASSEAVSLLRSMGLISAAEAEAWRGLLTGGAVFKESLASAKRAKTLMDALMILGEIPINHDLIRAMVQIGFLPASVGRVYHSLIDLGVKEWKVFTGSGAAEGFRRRLLLMLTGSMNAELLDFLRVGGYITPQQWAGLQILEIGARNVNDELLESLIKRKFRVRPGEAPIKTFARASRVSDGDLLQLLAEAAREARKEAESLAALGIGGKTRARQFRLAQAALHQAMRNMWDGVGYLTIWGEKEAAGAALESVEMMQKSLLTGRFAQLGDSLLWQSRAGVDAYISRAENTLPLSRRVYKNIALWQGNVDKRINLSLLQGKSAAETARDVERFISPNTPGGVAYAAKRLARTEINNAFHLSTIRYTRENPWVRGYKWNLSGSHGKPDVCNQYASEDHDNLGAGVFKKANVPSKPHPHCLCYLTVVQMDEAEFLAAHNAGRFDAFYKTLDDASTFDAGDSSSLRQYLQSGFTNVSSALRK